MSHIFDPKAPRRAANVSINADLLRQARELGVNLSRTLETRLEEIVREERKRQWREENRAAIEAFAEHIERNGTIADAFRTI
jgi:antitoxin CcdA